MILSLRQIRRRIRSVENTKKITRAMEMVAAAKLKKLEDLLRQSDRYLGELGRILETLVREKPILHPLLEKRTVEADSKPAAPTLIFLITSDTGLCGSYNANVLDHTKQFIESAVAGARHASPLRFMTAGKYGTNFLKRLGRPVERSFAVPKPQDIDGFIHEVTQTTASEFTSRRSDRVVFIYTKVFSLGSLKPAAETLFPIESSSPHPNLPPQRGEGIRVDYIIEPSLSEVLDLMVPEFIEAEISRFVKHSLVAEQASRMMAMRQATDSAKEMIDSLTLARNKARQAAITKELLEVVSGSRALQMK
ncbi:MAG: ATP synthase F1 subunit gamma [Candidatus Omnitrophica bacterium]|nr:ATP synthase F1 subunit gamma [Candidatus Omnitrophota bacterium]